MSLLRKHYCSLVIADASCDAVGFARPTDSCVAILPPLDLLHLIGLRAARRDHFDRCTLGLADQRARERRGDRDAAGLGVRLRLADDLPYLLLVGVLVDQRDGRAELDGFARQLGD